MHVRSSGRAQQLSRSAPARREDKKQFKGMICGRTSAEILNKSQNKMKQKKLFNGSNERLLHLGLNTANISESLK